jgi:hypothetical protein
MYDPFDIKYFWGKADVLGQLIQECLTKSKIQQKTEKTASNGNKHIHA